MSKCFFNSELNRVLVLIMFFGLVICGFLYNQSTELKALRNEINISTDTLVEEVKTNRNKIHYRYFNLTKSLEKIHDVEIDTKTGELKK